MRAAERVTFESTCSVAVGTLAPWLLQEFLTERAELSLAKVTESSFRGGATAIHISQADDEWAITCSGTSARSSAIAMARKAAALASRSLKTLL
jgi:hypothetical protein